MSPDDPQLKKPDCLSSSSGEEGELPENGFGIIPDNIETPPIGYQLLQPAPVEASDSDSDWSSDTDDSVTPARPSDESSEIEVNVRFNYQVEMVGDNEEGLKSEEPNISERIKVITDL